MDQVNTLALECERARVYVTRSLDGLTWRALVCLTGGDTIAREFDVIPDRPDQGLLTLSRALRREFRITGTYVPTSYARGAFRV